MYLFVVANEPIYLILIVYLARNRQMHKWAAIFIDLKWNRSFCICCIECAPNTSQHFKIWTNTKKKENKKQQQPQRQYEQNNSENVAYVDYLDYRISNAQLAG